MAETVTPAEAPKKGKSKLLVMVALALVVAAAAYFFLLKPKDAATAEAAAPVVEKGEVLVLDPIYVNLAQGHFLKLGMALQATKDGDVKHMDGSEALDSAIEIFSGQDMEKLGDAEVRAEYKKQLVEKVVESYEKHVMDVYFTEFVMQ
ncbi:MAG: flagellar basal body-associated FliL family protein [Actinobacteria bacterium]|jgi:flagellar FliL protein|nr:flagellar basal body-associated FliL family protein [Actinomycetota bacterium]